MVAVGLMFLLAGCFFTGNKSTPQASLWDIYERSLKNAKYMDLSPDIFHDIQENGENGKMSQVLWNVGGPARIRT